MLWCRTHSASSSSSKSFQERWARRGKNPFQSQEIADKLKDFASSTGPFVRVSMDDLGAEATDEVFGSRVGWPPDKWRAAGEKPHGVQDIIQGTVAQSFDSAFAQLEQLSADNVLEITRKGIAQWSTVFAGGLVHAPRGYIVVDVTVGASLAIGCKLSVLLKGFGAENLGLLSALFKQRGRD